MKRSLLLLLFLCIAVFDSQAQFYDHYNYYLYIEVGKTPADSGVSILYVHFDSDGDMCCSSITKSTLISKYNSDVIDEYAINKSHSSKYDSDTSTYKYEVYVKKKYRNKSYGGLSTVYNPYTGEVITEHSGYDYYAFSNDRKEMIRWYTTLNSDEPRGKKYYKLVQVEEFIPEPANYDFLR